MFRARSSQVGAPARVRLWWRVTSLALALTLAVVGAAGPVLATPPGWEAWSTWSAIPGDEEIVGGPAAVTFGARFYALFRDDGGHLWYASKGTVGWKGWKRVPGTTRSRTAPPCGLSR